MPSSGPLHADYSRRHWPTAAEAGCQDPFDPQVISYRVAGSSALTWPCRYLASASASAALTTWTFSASAFSSAATLHRTRHASPHSLPYPWSSSLDVSMVARQHALSFASTQAVRALEWVCRLVARSQTTDDVARTNMHMMTRAHLRRCAALISFMAARTFRSGSMSAGRCQSAGCSGNASQGATAQRGVQAIQAMGLWLNVQREPAACL